MNPSEDLWSNSMYSSSNICLDGCTAEHLSSFQPDVLSNAVSGVSVTLNKDSENMKMPPGRVYYSGGDAGPSLICPSQLELLPPGDAGHVSTRHPLPAFTPCGPYEWSLNSGHEAKRARVENIIKGMVGSPGMHCADVVTNESERNEQLPLPQDRSGRGGQQEHLRELRTRLHRADGEDGEEEYPSWNSSSGGHACSEFESSSSRKHQGWKKVKLMNYFKSKPERIKLMADVLKYELSRAVSRSVDSIFQSAPLLQPSPGGDDEGHADAHRPLRPPPPGVQSEALSLVVRKPRQERADAFVPQSHSSAALRRPEPAAAAAQGRSAALRCLQDGCSKAARERFQTFDAHWDSVKVRSKVNSRSVRSPQTHTGSVDPKLQQSMRVPHVKVEPDVPLKNNLCMLNEGLTTNHLKKAKLMFFYTRYPSSLVLKMCFYDVQFTRCITSQLIKWFSNFREFYYIQMEKFARHALLEGVSDEKALTVGRESELFRALNMHYNKANDFQVPDGFLEVAEITLREFYMAILMGKDRDPSWKKTIYKVICKLDSSVPAEFKNHRCG